MKLEDVDLLDLDRFQRQEHHEMFAVLRAEDPVHWTDEPDGPGFWSITKHADLVQVNRDHEVFSAEDGGITLYESSNLDESMDMRGKIMVMTDPPRHTRYRLLVNKGFTLRTVFWMTGLLAFFISPVADNLTTALLMGAVAMAVGGTNKKFVVVACINIVVAANAGGAFSPFGDITTLMVWQKDKVTFLEFFALFVPSLVNWLVPAIIMHFGIPQKTPVAHTETVRPKPGAMGVIVFFALTIATAVSFRNFLHLPPAMGMMLGLGYLQAWSYFLQRKGSRLGNDDMVLNSFKQIERVEWDTLLFFFGILFAVGGLGVMGYLAMASEYFYVGLGPTVANIAVGVMSAVVDNIPVMFAVLTMDPAMSHGQWLLVTLTAGVGGSLLSIGSAAGVALMGQAPGQYTFFSHLKWSWAIALGYAASIATHLFINASLF